jgi:tRNA pseudouridine55 synthase
VSNGLVIVDKPAGWTSHDVVSQLRRFAHTRKVGHAGTLDPMATGVLVVAVGSATRLLHHLTLTDKTYTATIRLGESTVTDDAQGEVTGGASAAAVDDPSLRAVIATLTGSIMQVPSAVSAIKVNGERAYKRVRDGETVDLPARPVTVSRFDIIGSTRPTPDLLDVEVEVDVSSGTYIRALARDLGAALGVGGHLTALRRTRVGPFDLSKARTIEELRKLRDPVLIRLPEAVAASMPVRSVDLADARELSYGRSLSPEGIEGTYAAVAPDGTVVALLTEQDGRAKPVAVFASAG